MMKNMRRSKGMKKQRKARKLSSSDMYGTSNKRRFRRNRDSSTNTSPTKSVEKKKKKVKKRTPFEKFSSKQSKNILKEYRSTREVLKGRRKTQSEIEKEKQIALNQYYENGLLKYREERYSESYELLKRGYSSLQHAITHIFEFSQEEMESTTTRSSRKKKSTMTLIRGGKSSRKGKGGEEEVDFQNIFEFIKMLSKDMSFVLCKVCFILKCYDECIYFAEKTLLLDPVSTKCYQYSAFSAYRTKDYVKAAELFEKLLLVTPPPFDKDDISIYVNPVAHGLQNPVLDDEDDEYEEKRKKQERKKSKNDRLYVETIELLTDCTDKLERHGATVKYSSMLIEHYCHVLNDLSEREHELIRISELKKISPDPTEMSQISQERKKTHGKLAGLYYTRACSNELLGGQIHPFFHLHSLDEDEMESISKLIDENNKLELKDQKDEEKIKLAISDYSQIISYDDQFLTKFLEDAEVYRRQVNLFESLKTYLIILRIERDQNLIFTYSIIISFFFQDIKPILQSKIRHEEEKREIELFLLNHSVTYISNAIKLQNEVSFFPNEMTKNKVLCNLYLQRGKYFTRILSLMSSSTFENPKSEDEEEIRKSIIQELKKNILLDFSISMEHCPKNFECFKYRGLFFLTQNRIFEAKDDFEKYVTLFDRKQRSKLFLTEEEEEEEEKDEEIDNLQLEFANYDFFEKKKEDDLKKKDNSVIFKFLFDLYYFGDKNIGFEEKIDYEELMMAYHYENTNFKKCVDIISKYFKDTFSSSSSNRKRRKKVPFCVSKEYLDKIIFCFCKNYESLTQQKKLEETIKEEERLQEKKKKKEKKEEEERVREELEKKKKKKKEGGEEEEEEKQEKKRRKSNSSRSSKTPKGGKRRKSNVSEKKKGVEEEEEEEEEDQNKEKQSKEVKGNVPSLYQLSLSQFYEPLEKVNGPYLKEKHDFRKCFRSVLLEFNLDRGVGNDLLSFSLGGPKDGKDREGQKSGRGGAKRKKRKN